MRDKASSIVTYMNAPFVDIFATVELRSACNSGLLQNFTLIQDGL